MESRHFERFARSLATISTHRFALARRAIAAAFAALLAAHAAHPLPVLAGGCGACDDDGDGLTNAEEVGYGTDLANPDTDGDSLSDAEESFVYASSPGAFDTDGDGRNDFAEISIDGTDPLDSDTDGDGVPDGMEY